MGEEDKKDDQPPAEEAGAVIQKKDDDLIGKANQAAERIEKANEQLGKLLQKQEQMKVEETLAGHAKAGGKREMSKDDKIIEETKGFLKGTGFENMFDKPAK